MMLGEKLKMVISLFGYNLDSSNVIRFIMINVDIGIINKLNLVLKEYVAMNLKNSKKKFTSFEYNQIYKKSPSLYMKTS